LFFFPDFLFRFCSNALRCWFLWSHSLLLFHLCWSKFLCIAFDAQLIHVTGHERQMAAFFTTSAPSAFFVSNLEKVPSNDLVALAAAMITCAEDLSMLPVLRLRCSPTGSDSRLKFRHAASQTAFF
jgi:hypothetical protein